MNSTDVEHFEGLLREQRTQLEQTAQIGKESSSPVELDLSRVGRLSRMDALQAQAMSIESVRRREAKMRKIDAALERIRKGDYGFCLQCGEAVDPSRLHFDPSASLCIRCANDAEA